ncbi:MAG: NAD(P)-dependent oxidoreductase [Tatlockia sp.]|jgi:dTDP-glucose 4,6-dehydratase
MNPLAQDLDYILNHTHALWEELRQERIFITGGTGFFGCWFLETFFWVNRKLGLNASITVLTRNREKFLAKYPHFAREPSLHCHEGDVRNFVFPKNQFAYVIHAATDTSAASNPLMVFESITQGTQRVLEFARVCNAKKILLTSSGAVYGKQVVETPLPLENQPALLELLQVKSSYAVGKSAAEQLAYLYSEQYQLDIKIARCFAFVGPYLPLDGHFAIGNFILDALKGGPITIKGDGTPVRSYLYAADLAIWLMTILFRGEKCLPYNVGSDEAYSLQEVAHLVASTFEKPIAVTTLQDKKGNEKAERYVPNIDRARELLHLKPGINLEQAIHLTKAWLHRVAALEKSRTASLI